MPSDRLPSPRTPQAAQSLGRADRRFAPRLRKYRANSPLATLLCATFAASIALGGCAVPGEPTARHPVTPEPVSDLAARQQGDAVVLTFTLPKNSTDKKSLAALPTVEVYRSNAAASTTPVPTSTTPAAPQAKPAPRLADTIPGGVLETYQKNGRIEFPDPLDSADLALNPGQQMAYFVRTRVSGKRASANSNAVALPVFPAPPPISGSLHATVTEDAIVLDWTAPPAPPNASAGGAPSEPTVTGYRVYRAEVALPGASTSPQDASKSDLPAPLALLGRSPQPEYRDATIFPDHTYSYIVRSLAQFGSITVESADSPPLVVFAKDVFPPAAPQELETVIVPETAGVPAYVELAWNISPESDFAGYVVFRSEQSDTTGARLTPELLSAPTFRDMTVAPSRKYFYRVAAVDRDGNISPLSAAVEADVP